MGQPQQRAVANRQPQQQAVQQQQSPNAMAQAFTNSMMKAWTPAIKDIMPPDKFARIMLTAINGSPKVQSALMTESGKASLMKATMQSAQTGLVPDGYEAHLVPFNSKNGVEIQFIPDYKGLVKLARNSGDISTIIAETVCEHDKFSWKNGEINHEINWFEPRGKVMLYYVLVKMKDGSVQSKVMNKDDVEKIRARSRSKDNGPWVTDYDAMALKTTFKQISKWLPRSNERLATAIKIDNENDFPQMVDVTPQNSRFAPSKHLPNVNGGLLGALSGQAPVEQTVETQNAPQNNAEPQKPQDIEEAINNALAERQAPVGYNQLREWYEVEHGQWDPVEVFNNLDNCINRTLDWLESTANNNNA